MSRHSLPVPAWVAPMFREIRIESGLSQEQLSHKAGVSRNAVGWVESGRAASLPMVEKLLSVMGYEIDFIKIGDKL